MPFVTSSFLLLEVGPGASSSLWLLEVRPGATSSFLLLVAMPFVTSSLLLVVFLSPWILRSQGPSRSPPPSVRVALCRPPGGPLHLRRADGT